jgi:fructoselysine-6-P-deglycase FrlB-like protein
MSTMWEVVKKGFYAQLERKALVAISKKGFTTPVLATRKTCSQDR